MMSSAAAVRNLPREEIAAYLDGLLGPVGEPDSLAIELGAVRRMALAIEDFDPIHFDHNFAVDKGYRGIVAPWPLLWLIFFTCSEFEFDFPFGKATFHGSDDYEFHEPMIVGDVITVHTSISETTLKDGRTGLLAFIVEERRFTNQNNQLCAILRTTAIRR